ncbi:DUF1206 domain-containing protein [Nocardioides panacihumi]|uniref:DUF1206 domain-containing protein n=1 Tax=Nocardioides panacihumi TaxID=400774 RepID=A0ABN2RR70_9ACTN
MTQVSSSTVTRAAAEAQDHPALSWTARLGFACYGLVYLLIGWLAAQLALGDSQGSPSRNGALAQVAQEPFGRVVLWVAVAGFSALVVWELCQLIVGHRDRDGMKKVVGKAGSAAKAAVFATLAVSAYRVADSSSGSSGGGGGSGSSSQGWTARVLSWPAGPALVAAGGAAIVAYAIWSVVKGVTDRWTKEVDVNGRTGNTGRALAWTARTGYVGRGAAFAVVGGLVVWAALTRDPQKSGGLDEALRTVRDGPAGPLLLALIALGLACFGIFNIAKAWHLRQS